MKLLTIPLWMLFITIASILTTSCSKDEDFVKIRLNHTSVRLLVTEKCVLTPVIENGSVNSSLLIWESSEPNVATVNNGEVTALSEGITRITLSYQAQVVAICEIEVYSIIAEKITLSSHKEILHKGDETVLTADIYPINATTKDMVWSSSNNEVATVSESGVVKANSCGDCLIRVMLSDKVYDECLVVVEPIIISAIDGLDNCQILLGTTKQLNPIITPQNPTNPNIIWKSSHPNIVSVDSNGLIYGKSYGTAKISAMAEDNGNAMAECYVECAGIDAFIEIFTSTGFIVTSSYTSSTLSLHLYINTASSVLITSVKLTDSTGKIIDFKTPNQYYNVYEYNFIAANHGWSNGENINYKGWHFRVVYWWNNNEYVVETTV